MRFHWTDHNNQVVYVKDVPVGYKLVGLKINGRRPSYVTLTLEEVKILKESFQARAEEYLKYVDSSFSVDQDFSLRGIYTEI